MVEDKKDEQKVEQQQIKDAVGKAQEGDGSPNVQKDAAMDVSEAGSPSVPSPMTQTINDPSMQVYPPQPGGRTGVMEISEPPKGYEGMQPSVLGMQQGSMIEQGLDGQEAMGQDYGVEGYAADPYVQYQPYQETMSSDVITEISEQVVSERLEGIQDKLEQAIDFRTVAEARISSLNERLVRIEKIMDRLQLSLLQKVGEYVNDVSDLKHELGETQKSFKALLPGTKRGDGRERKGREVP